MKRFLSLCLVLVAFSGFYILETLPAAAEGFCWLYNDDGSCGIYQNEDGSIAYSYDPSPKIQTVIDTAQDLSGRVLPLVSDCIAQWCPALVNDTVQGVEETAGPTVDYGVERGTAIANEFVLSQLHDCLNNWCPPFVDSTVGLAIAAAQDCANNWCPPFVNSLLAEILRIAGPYADEAIRTASDCVNSWCPTLAQSVINQARATAEDCLQNWCPPVIHGLLAEIARAAGEAGSTLNQILGMLPDPEQLPGVEGLPGPDDVPPIPEDFISEELSTLSTAAPQGACPRAGHPDDRKIIRVKEAGSKLYSGGSGAQREHLPVHLTEIPQNGQVRAITVISPDKATYVEVGWMRSSGDGSTPTDVRFIMHWREPTDAVQNRWDWDQKFSLFAAQEEDGEPVAHTFGLSSTKAGTWTGYWDYKTTGKKHEEILAGFEEGYLVTHTERWCPDDEISSHWFNLKKRVAPGEYERWTDDLLADSDTDTEYTCIDGRSPQADWFTSRKKNVDECKRP